MFLAVYDVKEIEKHMRASLDALKREFSCLRTGRASINLLDPVQVIVYGSRMPLNQVATVSVPETRMITVQIWDRNNIIAVEKAIHEANLGFNPIVDGQILRLPIPALTADRRQELIKLAHKYAEQAKVSVRNVRREAMDVLKKLEKDGKMSQDDQRDNSEKVQDLTDLLIKEVDAMLVTKEAEIQKV